MKKTNFWNKLMDSKDTKSSKRFITLIMTGIYIITHIDILFLINYVSIYTIKGKVEPELLKALTEMIHWNALIILGGLGFITASQVGNAVVAKMKGSIDNYMNFMPPINEGLDQVPTEEDPKKQ
jgi:hypothetical protein